MTPPLPRLASRRLLATNLALLTVGELVSRALTAVAFIHLARIFAPATYGVVEIALAILMIMTLLIDQGLGTWGARELARRPDRVEEYARRVVSLQLFLALLLVSVTTLILWLLPLEPTLRWLTLGFAVTLLGYPFLLQWIFQGRNQMIWIALPQIARQTIFAVVVLAVVRRPDQVLLLPLAEGVAVFVAILLNVGVYRRGGDRLALTVRRAFDRPLLADALPIGGSQIVWALRMYLPVLLVGWLAGQAAAGYFGAPHRIIMVLQALMAVYFTNLLPSMSQLVDRTMGELVSLIHGSLRLSLWLSFLGALVGSLLAPLLIGRLFGAQYLEGSSIAVFTTLIWIIPILGWRGHARNGLIVLGRQSEEWWCAVGGVALMLLLLVPLTRMLGAPGAALAMLISEGATTMLTWWRFRRHVPLVSPIAPLFRLSLAAPEPEGETL